MKLSDEAKKQKLLFHVSRWHITVEKLPYAQVQKKAIKRYNTHLFNTGQFDKPKANTTRDREFLDRISVNYIRHNLTNYDKMLDRVCKKMVSIDVYVLLNQKIYQTIGETYLNLKDECDRQMESKK
jgi:hypothetical protein